MVDRAIVAVLVIIAVVGVSLLIQAFARRRVKQVVGSTLPTALTERLPGRAPAIIYFYGAHCADCRQQAVVLEKLAGGQGIAVARVDAASESDLADALSVMTVPSTVVVDIGRRIHAVNLGFRSHDHLLAQLHGLGAATTSVA
jgi:thioredoxin-like negative regulator of GroEL